MACCMAALVFVYQLIDVYRRARLACGWPVRTASRLHQRLQAWRLAPARPLHRAAFIVLVAFELGLGGGYVVAHRDHLQMAATFTATSFASVNRLCRAGVAAL